VLRVLHLAVLATSVMAINTDDTFNTGNFIISFHVQQPANHMAYSMNFVEASSLLFLPAALSVTDRLAGASVGMSTANALAEGGMFGEINLSSSTSKAKAGRKGSTQSSSKVDVGATTAAQRGYELSYLSYLLHESLFPEPVPSTLLHARADETPPAAPQLPKCATLLVACLRGCESSLPEDRNTMEFLAVLSERFHLAASADNSVRTKANQSASVEMGTGGGLSVGEDVKHNDSDSISALTPLPHHKKGDGGGDRGGGAVGGEVAVAVRRGHSIKEARDGLGIEISTLESHLGSLPAASAGTVDGKGGSSSSLGNADNPILDAREFLERKLFVLKRFKLFIDSPNSQVLTRHACAPTVPIYIQKWLKSRGVLGITVDEPPTHISRDDDLINSMLAQVPSSKQKKMLIDKEYVVPPWTGHHQPPDDPHLTPVTSLDFPRYYLHMAIPGGHMAVCAAPLDEDIALADTAPDAEKPAPAKPTAFGGLKHCKVFRLDGKTILESHCVFFRLSTTVKLRPLFDEDGKVALVQVNGRHISEETVLHHNDTIRIGAHCVFVLSIPNEAPVEDLGRRPASGLVGDLLGTAGDTSNNHDEPGTESKHVNTFTAMKSLSQIISTPSDRLSGMRWEYCCVAAMQFDFLHVITSLVSQLRHQEHMVVDRSIVEITKKKDLTDIMKLEAYEPLLEDLRDLCMGMLPAHKTAICEALIAVSDVNYWSRDMRRHVQFKLHLEPVPEEADSASGVGPVSGHIPRQYRGLEYGIVIDGRRYMINIRAEMLDDGDCTGRGDSWVWAYTVFVRRYFAMRTMHTCFLSACERDLELLDDLYPASADPFMDPSQPELIGVATFHLDSIFYLCDVRDFMPIVTFKGNKGGLLKMTVRTWIDEVETVPAYICVDKESKLSDFPGRKCIVRFYFESLNDINPALSSDVQIVFNFFHHSGQYRTTRHPARNAEEGDRYPFINSTLVVEQKITPDFIRYVQKKCIELEIWGSRITNRVYAEGEVFQYTQTLPRVGETDVVS
jgi:hypothetical protein